MGAFWTLAALSMLATPPAAPPPAAPPPADHYSAPHPEPVLGPGVSEDVVPAGAFSLVTTTYVPRPGALAVPHAGPVYPTLTLRWRPADSRWRLELIDNGGSLTLRAEGNHCFLTSRYLSYAVAPGEEPLFDQIRASFGTVVNGCPRVTAAQAAAYRAELAAAAPDFAPALEEMKRRALQLFRRLERCVLLPSEPGGPPQFAPLDNSCPAMR